MRNNIRNYAFKGVGMKKIILIMMLVLSTALMVAAEVDIGFSGFDSGSQDNAPLRILSSAGWSKSIYPRHDFNYVADDEFGNDGPSAPYLNGTDFYGIRYYFTTANSTEYIIRQNQSIYMRLTNKTVYGDNDLGFPYPEDPTNGFSEVYSGEIEIDYSKGYIEIEFDEPFFYEALGEDFEHLEVVWLDKSGVIYAPISFTSAYERGTRTDRTVYKQAGWGATLPDGDGSPQQLFPAISLFYDMEAPGAANLTYPLNNIDIYSRRVTFKWEQGDGPSPTGYKLYLEKAGEGFDLIAETAGKEFSTADLDYETTYNWKVIPYNNEGDSQEQASVGQFTITAHDRFYSEGFTDGYMPDFWRQWKGVGIPSENHTEDISQWTFTHWLNDTSSSNQAATMKVQGNNIEGWLVSPAFKLPNAEGNNELTFNLGLTSRNKSKEQIQCLDGQIDDRFIVYMSPNPGMGGYTKLIEWNNTGSPHIYNNIPHTGTKVSIPLNTTGYVYFGFFVQSTVDNGMVDLFIDNVTVRNTPSSPKLQVDEEEINYGFVNHGVVSTRNLTIRNIGGKKLTLTNTDFQIVGANASMFSINIPNNGIELNAGEVYPLPINLSGNNTTEQNLPVEAEIKIYYDDDFTSYFARATVLPEGDIVVGNSVANCNVPTRIDRNYSYSQTILLDSEISVGYKEITEIKYYWNDDATYSARDLEIYMGHTKNESFVAGQWVSNMKKVYPSNNRNVATYANGVLTIPIDPPYIMMDQSNLVVGVHDISGVSGPGFFNSTSKSTNRSMIYSDNYNNPNPLSPPTSGDNLSVIQAIPNISITLKRAFDVIPGEDVVIDLGDGDKPVITIVDGAGNIIKPGDTGYPGVQTPPNTSLTGLLEFILTLFGRDTKTVTIKNSNREWGAIHDGSNWMAVDADANGDIVFELPGNPDDNGKDYSVILADQNPTLPVELSYFSVILNSDNDAVSSWTTQTETGVNGFYIYRNMSTDFGSAELISSLIPATNSSIETHYSFTDNGLYETGTYYYWLLVLDINGTETLVGPLNIRYDITDDSEGVVPVITTIKNIYPNPFNPSTTIAYSLKDKEDVSFSIYNARGQLVYNIDRGTQDVGHYEYVWNGTDTRGKTLSSGVYFIRMKAGKTVVNKKAVLMK